MQARTTSSHRNCLQLERPLSSASTLRVTRPLSEHYTHPLPTPACVPLPKMFANSHEAWAGHGMSDWRSDGVYHLVDYVADIVYAADALKWDKFSMYVCICIVPARRDGHVCMHQTGAC